MKVKWTYGVMLADGSMESIFCDGPMPREELVNILGGEPEFVKFRDGVTAAVRKDSTELTELPVNQHFVAQSGELRGTVVLGKMDGDDWVGVLGVGIKE